MFYFIAYGLYYAALLWYKNPMRDILLLQKATTLGDWLYVCYYIAMHALAIHFFLTAGDNPGFVEETRVVALEMTAIEADEPDENGVPSIVQKRSTEQRKKPKQVYSMIEPVDCEVQSDESGSRS